MDKSVEKLKKVLEPLILDLDNQRENLVNKKEELESISRLLAYTNDNLEMVSVYADQDIIINNLDKLDSNKEEYKACCYLLKSENESVKNLPQYEKACEYIRNILDYFKLCKASLIVETQDLEMECREKEIEKKYYDIFSKDDLLVSDVKEFKEMLDKHDISDEDKINILVDVINGNIKEYKKNS